MVLVITIGQRRGIGISGSKELYVIDINKDQNSITWQRKIEKKLLTLRISIGWVTIFSKELDCSAKIRSTQEDLPRILDINSEHGTFTFENELDSTSPGQACVFTKMTNYLIGWITEPKWVRFG